MYHLKDTLCRWKVCLDYSQAGVLLNVYSRGERLRWIFRKWDVGIWTGSGWLRIGTGGGHL